MSDDFTELFEKIAADPGMQQAAEDIQEIVHDKLTRPTLGSVIIKAMEKQRERSSDPESPGEEVL